MGIHYHTARNLYFGFRDLVAVRRTHTRRRCESGTNLLSGLGVEPGQTMVWTFRQTHFVGRRLVRRPNGELASYDQLAVRATTQAKAGTGETSPRKMGTWILIRIGCRVDNCSRIDADELSLLKHRLIMGRILRWHVLHLALRKQSGD